MHQRRAAPRTAPTVDVGLPTGTVTFLFTDIEGSTSLLRRAGSLYGDLLADHRRLLRAAFAAHDGREVDTQGDSFFVAFARPSSAVAAAAQAQRALAGHPWPEPFAVRVRMGLHTGGAQEVGGSYVGMAVHRAARIAAAGHGGQILLSDATAALVRDDLPAGATLHDLGEHRLKDFEGPARLYQVDLSGLPASFPALHAQSRRGRLPRPQASFVGREEEVARIADLLRDHRNRLLTLVGPGGIGKTRLALEAAHEVADDLPGGAVFVPLAAVTDPALVIGAVADALEAPRDVGGGGIPAVAAALGEDRTLLVLDNLEQVLGAAGDLAELLDVAASAVVLATSRSPLRLRLERQFPVRPLPQAAAVTLFQERADAVRPGSGAAEPAVLAEISRRLDGLPLAIELAAARIRVLPAAALLERLGGRLDVLGAGPVDLPERQRTLRATMDWSHGLLTGQEQALFARLGVFAGGWGVDAAERVCGRTGEADLLDTLAGLVDASLVVTDDSATEPRFTMLETVRAYAAERLAAAPDREVTERRHTEWVLSLVGELMLLRGSDHRRAQDRFDRERANVRSVARRLLDAGDLAPLALLIRDSIGYFALRDPAVESVTWLEEALAQETPVDPAVRGRLLVLAAVMTITRGDMSRTTELLAEGEALLPPGPEFDLDRALAAVAGIRRGMEEQGPEGALRAVDEAMRQFRALGMEFGEVAMHQAAGELSLGMGRPDRAVLEFRASVDLAEVLGDDPMLGSALTLLGLSQVLAGNPDQARGSVLAGVRVNRRGGWPTSLAYSLEALAALALADGAPGVAARALAAASAARGRTALPLTPALPPLIDQLVGRSRAELGADAFDAAWSAGRCEELPDALERALRDLGDVLPSPPAADGG